MAAATKYPHSRFMDPRDPERGESPPPTSVSPKPREEKAEQVKIKMPPHLDEDIYKERDLKKMAARWLPELAQSKLSPGGRRRKTKKAGRRKHRRATRRRA